MVLHFSALVPCLQGKIAEKMNYFDLEQMEKSSRHGKEAVQCINIMPAVETSQIWFGARSGYIHIKVPGSGREIDKEFSSLDEIGNLPRFFVSKVNVKMSATPECITHSIFNDSRRFIDEGVKVDWNSTEPGKVEIMDKISEIFKIVDIRMDPQSANDHLFLSMDVFKKVEKFTSFEGKIPDDILLSLTAPVIQIGTPTSFPNMGPTLRSFFTQYFCNQRELNHLVLFFDEEPEWEDLFTGLEYFKMIWSVDTHERSDFAHVPRDQFPPIAETVRFYLIKGGEKKLLVFVTDFMMKVTPTSDESADVLLFIRYGAAPDRAGIPF